MCPATKNVFSFTSPAVCIRVNSMCVHGRHFYFYYEKKKKKLCYFFSASVPQVNTSSLFFSVSGRNEDIYVWTSISHMLTQTTKPITKHIFSLGTHMQMKNMPHCRRL